MRILLTTLNSKYVHSNLALKYLYGVSIGSGLDISLQEFTINNDRDYVYGEIVRGGYDLICFPAISGTSRKSKSSQVR